MSTITHNFGKNIWFDGKTLDFSDAKVGVMSHALHYGSSVFEGIRVYNEQPFKLNIHLERLFHSAQKLNMKIEYSLAELDAACRHMIQANQITNGYMRPLVWRGQGENTLIDGKNAPVHTMIAVWNSFEEKRSQLKEAGFKLRISSWKKGGAETVPHTTKSSAIYMMATLTKNEATSQGFDDGLMLDLHGNITEASTANIFFTRGKELFTPITDCFLNGITRQTIILEIAPLLEMSVTERYIKLDELPSFDGAFICGTALEIAPIRSISYEGKVQNYSVPNQFITSLMKAFHHAASGINEI